MIAKKLMAEIRKLDIDDRILLAHTIWDEAAAEAKAAPLTKAQMAELQRRLDKYGDSTEGIPWEEVERELIAKEKHAAASDPNAPRSRTGARRGPRLVRKPAKRPRR